MGPMRTVGIRELRDRLSHYVRLVEAGEPVLVTDRGTVVAELWPPGRGASAARQGRAVVGAPHDPDLYAERPRALPEDMAAVLLEAERQERLGFGVVP